MLMPATLSFSNKQARRLALAAQGFNGRQPPAAIKPVQLNRLIERLGILQIDSVNALVRSHYLPLYSRLGNYSQTLLDQAAWSQGRHRRLFEYWGHEASLLPVGLYPLLRWRMQQAAQGEGIYRHMAKFGREQQHVIARVLQAVREQGALVAGSLSTRAERAGPWWDWSAEKHALEWLFAAGEVTVAGRRGFERLYDLPERVLPAAVLDHPDIEETQAQRSLLLHAAAALGVATEKDLRDYFRQNPAEARKGLAELVEDGALQVVQVQGWRQPAFLARLQGAPQSDSQCAAVTLRFIDLGTRPYRTPFRFPLPSGDLHPPGKTGLRLLRVAVPAQRAHRRPGGPARRTRRRAPGGACRA